MTDKTALVTGSTAGIGLAIAKVLAAEGAAVVVNGRTEQRVTAAVADVKRDAPGANVRGIVADLGVAAGARQIVAQLPRVDILVNNIGIYDAKPFFDLTDDDWQRAFGVNVMSGVRLSRAYFGQMLKAN